MPGYITIQHYLDGIYNDEYKLSAGSLAAFRIFYILYSLFFLGVPNFTFLHSIPDYIYDPPYFSIGTLFSGFPGYTFLLVLSVLILVLHIMVLFGYRTKFCSIALTVLMFVGYSFYYSLGKINHDRLFVILIPFFLGLAHWGAAYSVDANINRQKSRDTIGWPVFALIGVFAFAMLTAGLPKLMAGWLDPTSQAVRGYYIKHFYGLARQALAAPFFADLHSPIIWETFDYFGVTLELFCIVVFFSGKKYLRFYFLFAILFHVANVLMLNISFIANLPIYMLLFPWRLTYKKDLFSPIARRYFRPISVALVAFLAVIYRFLLRGDFKLVYLFENIGLSELTFSLILTASVLCIYLYGIVHAYNQRRNDRVNT